MEYHAARTDDFVDSAVTWTNEGRLSKKKQNAKLCLYHECHHVKLCTHMSKALQGNKRNESSGRVSLTGWWWCFFSFHLFLYGCRNKEMSVILTYSPLPCFPGQVLAFSLLLSL